MGSVFTFLANIRERYSTRTTRCLNRLHRKLRTITSDSTPNPLITISASQVSKLQCLIFLPFGSRWHICWSWSLHHFYSRMGVDRWHHIL